MISSRRHTQLHTSMVAASSFCPKEADNISERKFKNEMTQSIHTLSN